MRPPCHPSLCSEVANRRALGEQPGAEPSSAGFPQGLGGWEEALGFVSLGAQGWEDSWVQIYWVGPSVESHGTFKNQKLPSEMDYKFCFIIVLTSVMDLRGQWRATPPHHPPPAMFLKPCLPSSSLLPWAAPQSMSLWGASP